MSTKLIGLITSIVFLIGTIGGFFWLWNTSKNITAPSAVAADLQPIEIESVKQEATDLLSGLSRNSDIPIGTPTDKMGRTNPFQQP